MVSSRQREEDPSRQQEREGVVVAHLGVAVEVAFDDGGRSTVRIKRRSGHVVGDGVRVRGEVLEQLPRRTELRRRDAQGTVHLVGANLDVVGIVVCSAPPPPSGFVDRAVVATRAAGLHPFLVVNKTDLESAAPFASELAATYAASLPLFPMSTVTGDGLNRLRGFLAEGHRGAFIGTTGVGKSSLLNALCPDIALRTGCLNDFNGKGCHTTTVATLHTLADGGELIDTPGFQDFGLVNVTVEELAEHFPGFEARRETSCRFRNCRHRTEPGCAVSSLVERQAIPAERYEAYRELLLEVEAAEEEARRQGWKK